MAKKAARSPSDYQTPDRAGKDIITLLTLNSVYGRRLSEVFGDWLELIEATLMMEAKHLLWQRTFGICAPDTVEVQALWTQMCDRYDQNETVFTNFAQALGVLKDAAVHDYQDIIGSCYMEIGAPNVWKGQYFTPIEIAKLMAMVNDDIPARVYSRIRDAIAATPGAQDLIDAADMATTRLGDNEWFWFELIPLIWPQFDPVTVCDPCVGSGIMLITTGGSMAPWLTRWGFVQLYGQDVDKKCAQMAKINCLLYGFNGHGLRCDLAAGRDPRPAPAEVDWDAIWPVRERIEIIEPVHVMVLEPA